MPAFKLNITDFNIAKLMVFFCFLCNGLTAFSQVHAEFDAPLKSGCSPLQINFQNNSTIGAGITYQWSFGNGNASTQFEPYAVFTSPGTYEIKLIVTDGVTFDTLIKSNFITVFSNPAANFSTSNERNGCIPFNIVFNNISTSGSSSIVSYYWDFGDGISSSENIPAHVYYLKGIFNVSLLVTDSNGCTGNYNKENYIKTYKPHSYFSSNLRSSCNGTLSSSFTNLSIGKAPLNFLWNFGDNTSSANIAPVHLFTLPGNYSVQLIAVDSLGCSDTLTRSNYVNITDVVASFTTNSTASCKNELIHFVNTSQNATQFAWNFGDSTFSVEQNPQHSYSRAGNYSVTLKVSNNGQCADSIVTIIVVENIRANFHVSKDFGCELPFRTQFIDNSTNAVEWLWKLGSGSISHEQNPMDSIMGFASLDNSKIFAAKLIAISPHGCTDTITIDSCITIVIPKIIFSPTLDYGISGCVPQVLNATNQSTYNTTRDQISSWKWDFGNGQISQNWNVDFSYSDPGTFFVSFTLTTALGCTAKRYTSVNAGLPQTPLFTSSAPDSVCASTIVEFQNLSQDPNQIGLYVWDFGDESLASYDESPSHTFQDTGYMNVSLSVNSHGCVQTYMKSDFIYVKGPYNKYSEQFNCATPLDYTFIADIKGADSFYWKFGELDSGNVDSSPITHTFPAKGDYTVELISANEINGCSYRISKPISARKIVADFTITDSIVCKDSLISFNGSVSQDQTYDDWFNLYKWYFSATGEHVSQSNPDGIITKPFTNSGEQYVSLTVQDLNGCADTKTRYVKIYQPEIEFAAKYETGCIPVEFIFSDSTLSDTSIAAYLWDFGDENISTEKNPMHAYENFGFYNVQLKVTDILGCSGEKMKSNFIQAVVPNPNFLASDSTLCKGDTIFFEKNSGTEIATYFWDFGDGATSADAVPFHLFTDTGQYSVSLHITDIHGCDTNAFFDKYISVQQPPIVNFSSSVLNSNCYPLPVQFIDLSVSPYLNYWNWNFGDNFTASEIQTPSHTYFKPGNYNVTLIASTNNGCSDTLTKNSLISINGPWAKIEAIDTICKGDSLTMYLAEKTNIYGIKWDLGNGQTSTNDTVKVAYDLYGSVFPSVMLYSDDNHVCDKIIYDTINVFELVPNFTINNGMQNGCTPFTITCSDISANANSTSWYLNNTFQADQNSYAQQLQIPGIYSVKQVVWNQFGCLDSVTKNIIVYPLPTMQISRDTLICRDQNVQLLAQGGVKYLWQPAVYLNNENISNPLATPDSSTTFLVRIEDFNGCVDDTSMIINVFQRPQITMRDTSIVVGEYINLNSFNSEIATYRWSPSGSLSCNTCYNPVARPLESTEYIVAVTDTHNCFKIDYAVKVEIMKKYTVDVPELFTPNGDGKNDKIYVRGWGIKSLLEFRIFNRWGEMVFESTDVNNGWDGAYKGEMQNLETFMYVVRVISFDNQIINKKGFIKIVR